MRVGNTDEEYPADGGIGEAMPGAAAPVAGGLGDDGSVGGVVADRLRAVLGGLDPTEGMLPAGPYAALAAAVLAGEQPSRKSARALLRATGRDLGHLLGATLLVRERHFGRRVKICILENARSGYCAEDCHYCSQSSVSTAEIERHRLRTLGELVEAGRRAWSVGAGRFCMVVSGRAATDADIDRFADAARQLRSECDIELCVSAGLMSVEQGQRLRAAGVGWVNHNLNTSRRFYPEICTTHTYDERVATLRNAQHAGLATCSGVIMGMGETDDDLVEAAEALRALGVASLPVNFLHPIDGTPLAARANLPVERALAGLCLFRLYNPTSDVRAAGGREHTLGVLQPLALYAATSIFAEGYLTTPGEGAEDARAMIGAMGFSVED